ncbi:MULTISPECIES: hypothetical protein [Actinosynnema]|uniref:hypothetical protein n=1 Tax=Actinosynnema TaxID=40566 RepID=UPI0020A61B08|nr:hypothetical protein [Actinosynnema pretiosum]
MDELPARLLELSPDLLTRVVEANCEASAPGRHAIDGRDAVRLACDLVLAGVDTPHVVDLACQSPGEVADETANALLRAALDDLGLPAVDWYRFEWTITRKVAGVVLRGEVGPCEGMYDLWDRWDSTPDSTSVAGALLLCAEWEGADEEERVVLRTRIRAFARATVELADQRLAEHDGRGADRAEGR